jgi:hypothetical protein
MWGKLERQAGVSENSGHDRAIHAESRGQWKHIVGHSIPVAQLSSHSLPAIKLAG